MIDTKIKKRIVVDEVVLNSFIRNPGLTCSDRLVGGMNVMGKLWRGDTLKCAKEISKLNHAFRECDKIIKSCLKKIYDEREKDNVNTN